jgi:hypothetical protein
LTSRDFPATPAGGFLSCYAAINAIPVLHSLSLRPAPSYQNLFFKYLFLKPIFYLRKKGSEYSVTASGSSDYIIEYKNETDLRESMEKLLKQVKPVL